MCFREIESLLPDQTNCTTQLPSPTASHCRQGKLAAKTFAVLTLPNLALGRLAPCMCAAWVCSFALPLLNLFLVFLPFHLHFIPPSSSSLSLSLSFPFLYSILLLTFSPLAFLYPPPGEVQQQSQPNRSVISWAETLCRPRRIRESSLHWD